MKVQRKGLGMPVRTRGAILRTSSGGKWEVADLIADDPRPNEVQVKMAAAGLCHSDDHLATGDIPPGKLPICGGHEGAGVVVAAGPNSGGIKEGDHVVFSFLPACGRCRWCSSGMQYLCDLGALITTGARFDDTSSFRLSLPDGTSVGQMSGVGTFAELSTVSVDSVVRIPKDIPFEAAALTSCGVGTGWGSAVESANVRPGDVVAIMGIGGIGSNAVQGASHAGASHILAVDPVPFKREMALQLGATEVFETFEEATEVARNLTNGQGADSTIVTVGVTTGEHVASAFAATRKAGTVVVTGLGDITKTGVPISLGELTLFAKTIKGSLFGCQNPKSDIPKLLRLYQEGTLKLDELITTRYTLDEINDGYRDMKEGKNIRGVVVYS